MLLFEEIVEEQNHQKKQADEISRIIFEDNRGTKLAKIQCHIMDHLALLNSGRERAILVSLLSLIFSSTELRHYLGFGEDLTANLRKAVEEYSDAIAEKSVEATKFAEEQWKKKEI